MPNIFFLIQNKSLRIHVGPSWRPMKYWSSPIPVKKKKPKSPPTSPSSSSPNPSYFNYFSPRCRPWSFHRRRRHCEAMEDAEIEKAVFAYLKKKGFKHTELVLLEEQSKNSSTSRTDPDVANRILSISQYVLPHLPDSKVAAFALPLLYLFNSTKASVLIGICRPQNLSSCYQEGYSKLRSWAHSSLDLYKVVSCSPPSCSNQFLV